MKVLMEEKRMVISMQEMYPSDALGFDENEWIARSQAVEVVRMNVGRAVKPDTIWRYTVPDGPLPRVRTKVLNPSVILYHYGDVKKIRPGLPRGRHAPKPPK
jgi:hypothetical protein